MSASPPKLHLRPPDARRTGLVVAGAVDDVRLGHLCAGFAEQGYEVMAPGLDNLDAAVSALAGPVVLLSLGAGAAAAMATAIARPEVVAVSLFDPAVESLSTPPSCAAIAHFGLQGGTASSAELDALRDRHPDLAVYPYAAEPGFIFADSDAARLARLRTLQLFHRAGGKAEMGG
jgi:carboxymethylenebutenolidase